VCAAGLWLFEFLDAFLESEGRRAGFDSIILTQSPQGGYAFFTQPHQWTIEILDVRASRPLLRVSSSRTADGGVSEHARGKGSSLVDHRTWTQHPARARAAHRSLLPHLSGRDGASCEPTCWFDCCMACRSTPLTLQTCANNVASMQDVTKCANRCTMRDAGGPEVLAPTNPLRSQARAEAFADGGDPKLVTRQIAVTNTSTLVEIAHAAWYRREERFCQGWLSNGRRPISRLAGENVR
jgi:hypothetical protein